MDDVIEMVEVAPRRWKAVSVVNFHIVRQRKWVAIALGVFWALVAAVLIATDFR
jgi:hypothetical protein